MIIVSGPDNSGKTSLVNRLCEDLGLTKMPKCSKIPVWEHPDEYYDWVSETIKKGGTFDIVDRCFIDELVYGPIMRRKIVFDDEALIMLSTALIKTKPLLILTDPGQDNMIESYQDREQYPKIGQNLVVREKFYERIAKYPFSEIPKYIFDYRFDPEYLLVKRVVKYYTAVV